MKTIVRYSLSLAIAAASCASLSAQSAVEALQLTQRDFKGTSRFMSMGGAFTALGGDLSAIVQNPAGIGVYRSSEVAATLDIDLQSTKSTSTGYSVSNNQTKLYCNNFGYVGTVILNSALKTFSWGVTYNRAASFDRKVGGKAYPIQNSLTNYIAAETNGITSNQLGFGTDYNPYLDNPDNINWLSILAYNSYLINNVNGSNNRYAGLFQNGTESDAEIAINEKGYIDNYEFTFGGNFNDMVYWGIGIGVNDIRYVRDTYYSESMANALVYTDSHSGVTNGVAEYALYNSKLISGTGWNFSFGLIFKPIQELRIGASVHTPTWYKLDQSYIGSVDYYMEPNNQKAIAGTEDTDQAFFSWKLRTPWKFNIGAAFVLGNKAIISADYELQTYKNMNIQLPTYDNWGYISDYTDSKILNENIKSYTQNANSFRLGAEYRVTNQFSVRLGYNLQLSQINKKYRDGDAYVLTWGTDPSFSLDKTTNYISAGMGYKYKNFYGDLAYVHKTASSKLMPYTSYDSNRSHSFDVKENNNSIVLSVGFKF